MVTINYPGAPGGGDWLPAVLAIYIVAWLLALGLALTRDDLEPVTKLMWVIVIIFVPVGGILLYGFLAPARPIERKHDPGRINATSTVSGTPWEENPGHVRDRGE